LTPTLNFAWYPERFKSPQAAMEHAKHVDPGTNRLATPIAQTTRSSLRAKTGGPPEGEGNLRAR